LHKVAGHGGSLKLFGFEQDVKEINEKQQGGDTPQPIFDYHQTTLESVETVHRRSEKEEQNKGDPEIKQIGHSMSPRKRDSYVLIPGKAAIPIPVSDRKKSVK
jgi:hypothetical protein